MIFSSSLERLENIEGFIDDKGNFLTRKQAGKHAFECDQISSLTDYLFSEDIW
jgi:hypothetical protein